MIKNMIRRVATVLVLVCLAAALGIPVFAEGEPVITKDLEESCRAINGNPVTLSVEATGAESYAWYRDGELLEGEAGPQYSFVADLSMAFCRYECVVRNAAGETRSRVCILSVLTPPVLLQDLPSSLTIQEGQTLTLTADANNYSACQWYTNVGLVDGQNGPTLSLTATADMNGRGFYCQFRNEAGAVSTGLCYVTVTASPTPTPEPNPKPTITKNPTGEAVREGERAIFIAKADNTKEYKWQFTNAADTITYDYNRVGNAFPGMHIEGGNTEMLTLTNIPLELNGWKVSCVFKNDGGEVTSSQALIQVQKMDSTLSIVSQPQSRILAMDEEPDFALTVQASASNGGAFAYQWYSGTTNSAEAMTAIQGATNSNYKPTRSEGTMYYRAKVTLTANNNANTLYTDTVSVTFTKAKTHEHTFGNVWNTNDISHWHQCTCGEHADEEFHTYVWTVTLQPTAETDGKQTGKCSVCGYQTEQPIPAGSETGETGEETEPVKAKNSHSALLIVLLIVALAVIGTAAYLIYRVLHSDKDGESGTQDKKNDRF